MKRILLIGAIVVAVAVVWLGAMRRTKPPDVPFAKVTRERIVSTLTTNGKVEPVEWASARAEAPGMVSRVLVSKGQHVAKGAPLVVLEARQAQADLRSAEARMQQAQAELSTLRAGGRSSDIAALDNSLATARQELASAQRDLDALQRLHARGAATAVEVSAARDRVERAQLQIQGIEARRRTLVSPPDRTAAEARLHEAESAATLARQQIGLSTVRSPLDGIVYQLGPDAGPELRAGAYLNAGDLVANVGKLDRVRVVVFVDEPDLGRVSVGMPVAITWDALPGRTWTGTVERTPTEIKTLGSRQVGEVQCIIDNPGRELLPGTNVNAEIRSSVIESAVSVPKEAIRRQNGRTGVFVLGPDDNIAWREVQLGAMSVARAQVLSGLKEGDSVALPTDRPLKPGMKTAPVYP